jgi:hypothetical protein
VPLVFAGLFLIDGIGKRVASVRARPAGTAWTWLFVAGVVRRGALPPARRGRLRRRELENFRAFKPAGKSADDPADFIVPTPQR